MGLSINDQLSPAMRRALAKIKNKRPVLEAAGASVLGISQRSFRDASLRAAEWEPLTEQTLERKDGKGNLLIESGAMWQSLAYVVGSSSVEIGTDREYGPTHQFGRGAIPARPFIPVVGNELSPVAAKDVKGVIEDVIMRSFKG